MCRSSVKFPLRKKAISTREAPRERGDGETETRTEQHLRRQGQRENKDATGGRVHGEEKEEEIK